MKQEERSHWNTELPLEAQQRRETFARFGLATYQAQCVERQLGILLATTFNRDFLRATSYEQRGRYFDVEFIKTLGQMLKVLQTRTTVPPNLESRLRKALEIRNWLAHRYFWERAGSLLTWDGREKMITELQEAADFLHDLDTQLTVISDQWLEHMEISKESVEAELQKYKRGENA